MIVLDADSACFTYRVAGVCVHDGHVLLHRAETDDFWALPGGRCELFETSCDTLEREMHEEMGEQVAVGRLLWVVENFFNHDGRRFHELGLYHTMALPEGSGRRDVRQEFARREGELTLIFRWFPVDQLEEVRLYPSFLRTALADLPRSPAHVIHTDPDD